MSDVRENGLKSSCDPEKRGERFGTHFDVSLGGVRATARVSFQASEYETTRAVRERDETEERRGDITCFCSDSWWKMSRIPIVREVRGRRRDAGGEESEREVRRKEGTEERRREENLDANFAAKTFGRGGEEERRRDAQREKTRFARPHAE